MGYMIEISESKKEKLSEHIEKALHELGKAMACVEQFGGEYGQRGGMNYRDEESYGRSMMGNRGGMNYRNDEWDDEEMSERRGGRRRRSNGRYY